MTEREAAALIQALPEDMLEELKRRLGEAVITINDALADMFAGMSNLCLSMLEALCDVLADLKEALAPKPKARINTESYHNYLAFVSTRISTVGTMRQHTTATGM